MDSSGDARRPAAHRPLRASVVAAVAGVLLSTTATAAYGASLSTDSGAAVRVAGTYAWGKTHAYADGLAITVGKPLLFQPTSTAVGHTPPNQGVKWRITVTNGTHEPFAAGLVTVYVKTGTDGEQAQEVFDSAGNLGDHLTGSVLPGTSATTVYGFDVPRANLGKIGLEVSPDFTHDSSHWVGPAR